MKVCIIGASGKLGIYMIEHCLARGYEVVGVCRPESVLKLERYQARIQIVPGRTSDASVIQAAVAGCQGVLTVLVPFGVSDYASKTAQAVLDYAEPDARLVFSCGWHISKDGQDSYSRSFRLLLALFGFLAKACRFADVEDQVRATNLIFQSKRNWTVVRGSSLEEGPSQGLPRWAEHVGDPLLKSDLTRRIDFALFMVEALIRPEWSGKAPAIVGAQSPSALRHAG